MKIQDISFEKSQGMLKVNDTGGSQVGDVPNTNFADALKASRHKAVREELNDLINEIYREGQSLKNHINVDELLKYKRLVTEFLDKAVSGMYQFTKGDYFDRQGRHNIYSITNKVNVKLGELTEQVLSEQKDSLNILSCIDDIRGLLVDLLL